MDGLVGAGGSPNLTEARNAANNLRGVLGFEPPSWEQLRLGARPPPQQVDEYELGGTRGWQHEAASRVEVDHRNRHVFPVLTQTEKALLRAQSGPAAGVAFSTVPCSFLTRLEPHLFRTLVLRRLHLPLSPCPRLCRCGRPLDSHGHHRAACSRAGVLGRRGFAVESAAARICREAGARVSTNVLMRDLDLGVPVADTRRLEVVADGLPLFGGMQLAVDTTLVSTLHCDGTARRGAAEEDGIALALAKRRKVRTYPGASMASVMVFSLGVRCSPRFRGVPVEPARSWRC